MAGNGYRTGYSDQGVLNGQAYQPEYGNDEGKYSSDAEKGPSRAVGYKGKVDPFGDETKSEVKYRTMAWWYDMMRNFVYVKLLIV